MPELTDADLRDLMHQLYLQNRRKVIRHLLTGNDTQCFTTEEYMEAWHKVIHHGKGTRILYLELAQRHLRTAPHLVREVGPGLWRVRYDGEE